MTTTDTRTRGQRWADAVTRFGGSWAFICTFVGSSAVWVAWNVLGTTRPDPYPFLFLNMLLTVISTFQQPFVLLSQNRQNEEDRQRDEEDRAQLRSLHKRLDDIDAKLLTQSTPLSTNLDRVVQTVCHVDSFALICRLPQRPGRGRRYDVLRVSYETGHVVVIGRELPLKDARWIAKNRASFGDVQDSLAIGL